MELPSGVVTSLVVTDAVEQVIDRCTEQLYDHYLDERVVPFAVGCAVENLFDAVERAAVQMDCDDAYGQVEAENSREANSYGAAGNGGGLSPVVAANPFALPPTDDPGMWDCEPEPVPCPIDSSARGAVRKRAAAINDAAVGLSNQSSKASLSRRNVPIRLTSSVFDHGAEEEAQEKLAGRTSESGMQPSPEDLAQQHDAAVAALQAVRPMSPTEADTLFLQRELAIPERPSSVADGSRRPQRRDGPEHQLRRRTLARERARRDHLEARQKQLDADSERESDMIRKATGKAHGAKFTMHDDGTILPMARQKARSSRNGKRPGSVGEDEVTPGVSVTDQGAIGADDTTTMLLQQTAAGIKPTFKAPSRVEPAFGGREARRSKRYEELRRAEERASKARQAREQEAEAHHAANQAAQLQAEGTDEQDPTAAAANASTFEHPLPLSAAAAAGLEEDGYFQTGIDEQPSIVQSLGQTEVAPGVSLREAGLGEVSGGKHPREGSKNRRTTPHAATGNKTSSGAAPYDVMSPGASPDGSLLATAPGMAASYSGVQEESKRGEGADTDASAHARASQRQLPVSPVTVKAVPPSGAGFAASAAPVGGAHASRASTHSPAGTNRPSTESTHGEGSLAADGMVRELRGRGGFAPSPDGHRSGGRAGDTPGERHAEGALRGAGVTGGSISGRSGGQRAGMGSAGHHSSPSRQRELEAAIGPSVQKYPRQRVARQAKPGPETHQPAPLWPGTSRFDPRGEAGPLGAAGVEAVHDDDMFLGSGFAAPTSSPSNSRMSPTTAGDGHKAGRRAGAEWGEAALRRSGGALIMNPSASIDNVATGERAVRLPKVASASSRQ